MRLTKDVVISIEMMNKLKGRQGPMRVKELAPMLNTTETYLEQLVNKLRKGNVIAVKRGPGGGVSRTSQEPVPVSKIMAALGRKVEYNKETKEGQLLEKVETLFNTETC